MLGSLNVGPRVMITREGLERTGLMMPGSRAAERFPVPAVAYVARHRTNARVTQGRISRRAHRRLSRVAPHRHARAESRHHVSEPGQSDHADHRRHRRGHRHARPHPAAHGFHRDHEMHRRALQPRHADLLAPDHRARAARAACSAWRSGSWSSAPSRHFWRAISNWSPPRIGISSRPRKASASRSWRRCSSLCRRLIGIRHIRPSLILRREMEETRPGWRDAARRSARVASLQASSSWPDLPGSRCPSPPGRPETFGEPANTSRAALADRLRGAVGGGVADAACIEDLGPPQIAASVRHGIANLYRPGAHAQSVLVALGVGVMFTLTIYLVQHGMIAEMNRTSPPGMPNVFLIDIAPKDRDAVLDLVKRSARRGRDAGIDRHRSRQADQRGRPGCRQYGFEGVRPPVSFAPLRHVRGRHAGLCECRARRLVSLPARQP